MSKVKQVKGRGIPVIGHDIDTDRIIPARFLRCVTFDGLGEQAFADDRAQSNGQHPFDLPHHQGASILVVNGNFGCGSSREHAPQSIARWGIQGIIGESFAEIFFSNCLSIGIPCVVAHPAEVKALQAHITANPLAVLTLCLESLMVSTGGKEISLEIHSGARQSLLAGHWDNCRHLASNFEAVRSTASNLPYVAWS
ncbi:MAG: 3-isopropylmalate dehydratase small subunit [Cyanobacteria bacterium P01_H01_bin.15]